MSPAITEIIKRGIPRISKNTMNTPVENRNPSPSNSAIQKMEVKTKRAVVRKVPKDTIFPRVSTWSPSVVSTLPRSVFSYVWSESTWEDESSKTVPRFWMPNEKIFQSELFPELFPPAKIGCPCSSSWHPEQRVVRFPRLWPPPSEIGVLWCAWSSALPFHPPPSPHDWHL